MWKSLIYYLILFNIIFTPNHAIPKSKTGKINIATNPNGVIIFINGKEIGKTPIENQDIRFGTHKLKLAINQFNSIELTFKITKKNPYLNLYYPITLINISGSPINAKIKFNDQKVGNLPLENLIVPLGKHKLKIEKAGFHSYKNNSYLINKRQIYRSNIFLTSKSKMYSTLMSTLLPGSGQIYSGRKFGYIIGLSAIGSAAMYFSIRNNFKNAKEQYLLDNTNYHNNKDIALMNELYSKMNSSYDVMKQKNNISKITLGITLTAWLYNVFDTYFFFPKNKIEQVSISNNNEYSLISFNFNF